ncbi:MAG: hypothetical protein KJO55_10460, partial [Gammaproteobacteria bacterium]|nr:hypothetical protein [Gammaproteobacteria bacterium]
MAFGKTITLFSECTARLVDESGTGQGGVTIERVWRKGDGESQRDETVTAPDGTFSFPAVTEKSFWAGILPGTPVIKQELIAHTPDG